MGCLSDLVWEMDAPGNGLLIPPIATNLQASELKGSSQKTPFFGPQKLAQTNWPTSAPFFLTLKKSRLLTFKKTVSFIACLISVGSF